MSLSNDVQKQRQEIKSDKMDMSFGEIINMYCDKEIIITPEYQRAFRWDVQKQTDFIESILLGIPFPSIFVAANDDGTWELIDGLQRVSTVLSFFGELKGSDKNNLILSSGGLLQHLEGVSIGDLPVDLKLSIKRTPCRVEIIQKDSHFEMRYELFKRLNTGGEGLTPQEIRNCVFRGLPNFKTFTDAIETHSVNDNLRNIVIISQELEDKMLYEELCLRFFALRNFIGDYQEKSVQDFFDKIMKKQCEAPDTPLINETFSVFSQICAYLNTTAENVFRLSRLNFSTSMFDSIMLTLAPSSSSTPRLNIPVDELLIKIDELKRNNEFKKYSGSASSSPGNIKRKTTIAEQIFFGIPDEADAN